MDKRVSPDTSHDCVQLLACASVSMMCDAVAHSCLVNVAGDIDVVMGGPPCQGVSGHNRHGARINILADSRCAMAS